MAWSVLVATGCVIAAQGRWDPIAVPATPMALNAAGVRVRLETPYVATRYETNICLRAPDDVNVQYRRRDDGETVIIDFWGELETEQGTGIPLKRANYTADQVCLSASGLRRNTRVVGLRLFSSEPITIVGVRVLLYTG